MYKVQTAIPKVCVYNYTTQNQNARPFCTEIREWRTSKKQLRDAITASVVLSLMESKAKRSKRRELFRQQYQSRRKEIRNYLADI